MFPAGSREAYTPPDIRVRIRRFGGLSEHLFPQEGWPPGFRTEPLRLRFLAATCLEPVLDSARGSALWRTSGIEIPLILHTRVLLPSSRLGGRNGDQVEPFGPRRPTKPGEPVSVSRTAFKSATNFVRPVHQSWL